MSIIRFGKEYDESAWLIEKSTTVCECAARIVDLIVESKIEKDVKEKIYAELYPLVYDATKILSFAYENLDMWQPEVRDEICTKGTKGLVEWGKTHGIAFRGLSIADKPFSTERIYKGRKFIFTKQNDDTWIIEQFSLDDAWIGRDTHIHRLYIDKKSMSDFIRRQLLKLDLKSPHPIEKFYQSLVGSFDNPDISDST